jgi:predicted  nucleic acid-binding Zn-ribbon protein
MGEDYTLGTGVFPHGMGNCVTSTAISGTGSTSVSQWCPDCGRLKAGYYTDSNPANILCTCSNHKSMDRYSIEIEILTHQVNTLQTDSINKDIKIKMLESKINDYESKFEELERKLLLKIRAEKILSGGDIEL